MRALLDLLLPPRCAGCGLEGVLLCASCAAPLSRRLAEPAGAPLGLPADLPLGLLQLEWCAAYSGSVRAALQALKYRGERRLVEPLADALAERWLRAGAGGDTVTWVPVHRARLAERGFDQAQELAAAMAVRLRLPVIGSLERGQRTLAQHGLGQSARRHNIAGAFSVVESERARVAGRWLVVVDDIVTTGTTLTGCALPLWEAGAAGVSALCVARDR